MRPLKFWVQVGGSIGATGGAIAGAWVGDKIGDLLSGPAEMAALGNYVDTAIAAHVANIISQKTIDGYKKPDRCDVLQELIESGVYSMKDPRVKKTLKAWTYPKGGHSRHSKDKIRN